jgi:hypothetical protein
MTSQFPIALNPESSILKPLSESDISIPLNETIFGRNVGSDDSRGFVERSAAYLLFEKQWVSAT